MSVNLDVVFLGTKHAIEAMKMTGGGSIINMSPIEGIVGDSRMVFDYLKMTRITCRTSAG